MAETRRFVVVSLDRAVDSSETLTRELTKRAAALTPAATELHFLQAISHDGRVLVFFRELPLKRDASIELDPGAAAGNVVRGNVISEERPHGRGRR